MRCSNSSKIRPVKPGISSLSSLVARFFVALVDSLWAADRCISNLHNPVFSTIDALGILVCVGELVICEPNELTERKAHDDGCTLMAVAVRGG